MVRIERKGKGNKDGLFDGREGEGKGEGRKSWEKVSSLKAIVKKYQLFILS